MDEIVQRADEGRVVDLLLGEESGLHADLLNRAALKTLQHRGQAFTLKNSMLPRRSDAVAILLIRSILRLADSWSPRTRRGVRWHVSLRWSCPFDWRPLPLM
jgi:hypothetical protein